MLVFWPDDRPQRPMDHHGLRAVMGLGTSDFHWPGSPLVGSLHCEGVFCIFAWCVSIYAHTLGLVLGIWGEQFSPVAMELPQYRFSSSAEMSCTNGVRPTIG